MTLAGMLALQLAAPMTSFAAKDNQVKVATSMTQVVKNEDLKVGQVYEGFKLDRQIFSKDLNSKVNLFVHEKTGGQLVYIQNDDKNKWFAATFKTPTSDSTGINHIIEHTVLEGSDKYSYGSTFTEMGKRSVSTFMNALTGTDLTYFPIASENDKDFDNLMKVYLDAVYSPLVVKNEMIMKQEGWRYELDANGNLMFNGVVFNEMKGAMSNPYSVLFRDLSKALYPDTKYSHNSGGAPVDIVDLTHENLKKTHATNYTPSNACLLLYGDMNVVEKLKYINSEYYSKMDKKPAIVDNKVQKIFTDARRFTVGYPASPDATAESNSMLLWAAAMNDVDTKDRIGLEILGQLLSSGDHSPLYKNIIEKGLAMQVYAQTDTSTYQPSFMVLVEGASNKSMDAFYDAVQNTFKDVAKNGFPKERVEATLNQYELVFKNSLLAANRGQMALGAVNTGFVTYGDPLLEMNRSEALQEIKKNAVDGKYFEGLIEKYLLGNKHSVKMTFEPDAQYMAKINQKLDEKLKSRVSAMSEEELNKVKEDIMAYDEWQAREKDPKKLEELPKLQISDLDLESKDHKVIEDKIGDHKLLKHPVDSIGLTELSMYFNLKNLTQKELEYLPLFKTVLSSGDTENYTNADLITKWRNYTMGFNVYETCLKDLADASKYYPYMVVKTNYASENAEEVSNLMSELLLKAKFDDKDLVKTKLAELMDSKKRSMVNDASSIVSSRMGASLNAAGVFNDIKNNQGYKTLLSANADFEKAYPELEKNLKSIYDKVFTADELTVSIASEEADFKNNEKAIENLLSKLKDEDIKDNEWDLTPENAKVGMTIPAEVQYIQIGFNLNKMGENITGQDLVFANMLSDGYMYENIRRKGGAYGGYLSASMDGRVRFITYRDPNLKQSVDAIENVLEYLKTYKPTQDEINNSIITIAGRMEIGQALFTETGEADAENLIGYDKAVEERIKKEILATKTEDLQKFIAKMEKGLKDSTIIVAGSETKINKNKDLFDEIRPIDA
jgi:Zn-dependent M16 (insulinase) family peptidase